jgi:hypothetical protein
MAERVRVRDVDSHRIESRLDVKMSKRSRSIRSHDRVKRLLRSWVIREDGLVEKFSAVRDRIVWREWSGRGECVCKKNSIPILWRLVPSQLRLTFGSGRC